METHTRHKEKLCVNTLLENVSSFFQEGRQDKVVSVSQLWVDNLTDARWRFFLLSQHVTLFVYLEMTTST